MIILGIETSCDETAAAVLDNGELRSNIISIQDIHRAYGGVVPEFASREHQKLILPAISAALKEANVTLSQLNGIAVTYGPGLVGSVIVGLNVAKGLSFGLGIPFIGVNHIEGHLFANFVEKPFPQFPFICLIASGGHTQLILAEQPGSYQTLGNTIDDAAGEAFDKVARMLGLGYPGGPAVEKAGTGGDPNYVHFPRAMMDKDNLDFSFSGVKTAVLYHVRKISQEELRQDMKSIAASFETAVVDVLVKKTIIAAQKYAISQIVLAGGVAANKRLRDTFNKETRKREYTFFVPSPVLCTDNAAMIARAGKYLFEKKMYSEYSLGANASLKL